jgi:ABC-type lipoprotein release transport system permease subunit
MSNAESPRASIGMLLFLAYRNLVQTPLILGLMIAAVAAGVGFQVPNAANLLGYRAELLNQGVSAGFGDVRVRPRSGQRFEDADALLARLRSHPEVRAAIPVVTLPGAVGRKGHFIGVAVSSIDCAAPRQPFRLSAGKLLDAGDKEGLLLGASLAERLSVKVGDVVQLRIILGPADTALVGENLGRYDLIVRGIAAGTFGVCGSESAFVDRGFLGAELGEPASADVVLVYTDDHFGAQALAARLAAELPGTDVRAWLDDSGFLSAAIHSSAAIAAISHLMVVLAVVIPVWALLYIHVSNQRRQIGILRALGIDQLEIFLMFMIEALLVGLSGIALGLALGYGIILYFRAFPMFEMDSFVVRPVLVLRSFLGPALVILSATLLAGILPAWRAARVDPASTWRGAR